MVQGGMKRNLTLIDTPLCPHSFHHVSFSTFLSYVLMSLPYSLVSQFHVIFTRVKCVDDIAASEDILL